MRLTDVWYRLCACVLIGAPFIFAAPSSANDAFYECRQNGGTRNCEPLLDNGWWIDIWVKGGDGSSCEADTFIGGGAADLHSLLDKTIENYNRWYDACVPTGTDFLMDDGCSATATYLESYPWSIRPCRCNAVGSYTGVTYVRGPNFEKVQPYCRPGPFAVVSSSDGGCGSGMPPVRYLCLSMDDTADPKNLGEPPCGLGVGNPINVVTGNKYQREVDYAGAGALPLTVIRHYNSRSDARGSFGAAWRGDFERSLRFDASGAVPLVLAHRPDGKVYVFAQQGVEFLADADVPERLIRDVDANGSVTGWRYRTADDHTEHYDAGGRLVRISDRAGRSIFMQYDSGGHLWMLADDFGRTVSFVLDAYGRVASFTDPRGQSTRYEYNTDGMLSRVIYADGAIRTFVYNEPPYTAGTNQPSALTGIIDENGDRYAIFRYDGNGRGLSSSHVASGGIEVDRYEVSDRFVYDTGALATVTDPLRTSRTQGFQTSFNVPRASSISQPCPTCGNVSATTAYDAATGAVKSRTDFNGVVTIYQHADPYGRSDLETQRTEASGRPEQRTISTQWHPAFRLPALVVEPAPGGSKTTSFTYDADGNLTEKTISAPANDGTGGSAARTWRWSYTSLGRVLTASDPNGNVTAYTYYADDDPEPGRRGNLAAIVNAAGHVTRIAAYDAAGRAVATIDSNGLATTLAYDARGRITERQVGAEITRYAYDNAGQLVDVTQPDGSTLHYTYDSAHRLVQINDGAGNKVVYTLDAAGNRIAENVHDATNALARAHYRIYDSLNRLSQDVGTRNEATTYTYDGNGNLKSVTDPLGHQTSNVYDALNRLTTVLIPDVYATVYAYDPAGNLTQLRDPRLNSTIYTYDGHNNLIRQASPDTGTTASVYDSAGNVIARTDARGATSTYIYDALNRPVQVVHRMSGSPDEVFSFTYDASVNAIGRLSQLADPAATTIWTYDGQGRVASKSQSIGSVSQTASYGYNAAGQLSSLITPSGQVVSYSYSNNRVTAIRINGLPLITGAATEPFGPHAAWIWGNDARTFRDYDEEGRLAAWEFGNDIALLRKELHYDPAHRIVAIGDSIDATASRFYQYDGLNRLTLAQAGNPIVHTRQFAYDMLGNRQSAMIDGATVNLVYSAGNSQLRSISGAVPARYFNGAAVFEWRYNNANRMAAIESAGILASYAVNALGQRVRKSVNGATTLFFYDESGRLLGEYGGEGELIQETVWLEDLPVATLRPTGAQGSPTPVDIYYVHADHLGSPRAVTRSSDNAFAWRWDDLDPFGADLPDERPTGQGSFSYNLRFPGQYYDGETGTHYNYFRDYDPTVGRYVQSDPIGLKGGLNTYGYARNAPLLVQDPTGLDTYVCTRPLAGSGGIRFGPFVHEYICVWDDHTGSVTCGGIGPTGSMFGSPSRLEHDELEPTKCELVRGRDPCYESCVRRELASPLPEYDVRSGFPSARSGAEQCQVFARRIIRKCRDECRR